MKTVCKKLLSLTLVAMMLVSAVPFQAFASEVETTAALTETTAVTEAVETTAATEAAETTAPAETAPSVTVGGTVSDPAAAAVGDMVNVVFSLKEYPQANILTLTNMKIGYKVSKYPDANAVLNAYAQYAGTYTGKAFSHWELSDGSSFNPATTNVTDHIATAGTTLYIYGVLADQAQTINLNCGGGILSSRNYTHKVIIGQTYNYLGTLPTPVLEHHTFQYYYKNVNGQEQPVNGDTIVTDASALTAKWAKNTYTATFQRYDGSNWVTVETVSVPALGTLSTENGGFPTDAEINANFPLSGYKIVGWEIAETDKAFTAGTTKVTGDITIRPRYQGTVTLMANNPNDYTSNTTKSITVEIGEPVPSLPNPGARAGYTFADWVSEDQSVVISTKANLSNTAAHPDYYPSLGSTFYARWTNSTVVYLYIHTDGNTQTATTIVPYYEAPSEGAFNTNLINMYSVFSNYGNYDDKNDVAYGWYSASQWKNYCANTAANAATTFYNVGSNMDYCELHIMLINNGASTSGSNVNNNNYNNNISTADPSNPTTGDMIFMAVTVMAVSAAALAVIFFMKKRKASK